MLQSANVQIQRKISTKSGSCYFTLHFLLYTTGLEPQVCVSLISIGGTKWILLVATVSWHTDPNLHKLCPKLQDLHKSNHMDPLWRIFGLFLHKMVMWLMYSHTYFQELSTITAVKWAKTHMTWLKWSCFTLGQTDLTCIHRGICQNTNWSPPLEEH